LNRDAAEGLRTIAESGELDAQGRAALMDAMTRLAASLGDAKPAT
jgi:hypothetical protein